MSMVPELARAYDADTPDDIESGDFTDDGEPLGSGASVPICNSEPPVDIWLGWELDPDVEFTLPPAGTGNTWTIEYRASGQDVDLAWVETGQGSPATEAVHSLVLPPQVSDAALLTPLVLTGRAGAKDATGTEVGTRFTEWLILDGRSGSLQYERWEDHDWPTVTNGDGEVFPVAELDWDPGTAIRSLDGTVFPEGWDLEPPPPPTAPPVLLDQDLSFSTILEVWDRANPWSWRRNDFLPIAARPWVRIHDAAGQVGPSVQAHFASQGAIHGTDRL